MEDVTDADYINAKRFCRGFEIKELGKYHNLHLKRVTLLLTDASKNLKFVI